MGDISAHFSRAELSCKCCDFDTVDVELPPLLEMVRILNGNSPVKIGSGSRCEDHNGDVVGLKNPST